MGIFDEPWHSTCLRTENTRSSQVCSPFLAAIPCFHTRDWSSIHEWGFYTTIVKIWLWDDQIVRRTARICCWLVVCYSVKIWSNMFSLCLFLTNMHNYVSAFWICTTNGSKFPAMFCIHILNTHKTHQQNTDPLCEISNNHKKCCFHRIARITNDQSQPPTNASLTIYIYINTYLHIYI